MDTDIQQQGSNLRKLHYNDMQVSPSIMRQVESGSAKRKQLNQYFDKLSTLIIDYGSQTIKAGYDLSAEAELVFRPYVSKNRDPNRLEQPVKNSINTSYEQLDFLKQNYKSLFQRNIILHFSVLEQCNDYIFSELSKPNKRMLSNLIISEPFANPIHCRQSVLQQLFECYEVSNVMVGVDSLFKYFFEVDCNMDRYQKQSALLIDMGANTTHVFCILDGKVQFDTVKRLNIGGNQAFELFSKAVILKNPQLKNKLTFPFVRDLYQKFTSVAIDYKQQLKYFAKKNLFLNPNLYRNRVDELNKHIVEDLKFIEGVQIDFDVFIEIPQEELKRKEEIRQRMAEKLKQTIQRRKEMKKKQHQLELQNLRLLKKNYEDHDMAAHQEAAEMFGSHRPLDKLNKKIKEIQIKLGIVEQKSEQKKFSLIDIPDHELPPEKLKFKRMQMYQKKALEQRRQKQRLKQEQEQNMKQLRQNNPEIYLKQLKEKYETLSAKAKEHQRMKAEMANRKSKYNKKKMQVIARMAEEQFNGEEYQEAQQAAENNPAEQSDHFSELDVMEAQLRQIDPDFSNSTKDQHHLNSSNQLFLLTDLIKCQEVYFEPKIIGIDQMGLIEIIVSCINQQVNSVDKAKLLKNVIVVGGGSQVSGLKERLQRDLRRQCPVEMDIKVTIGKHGCQTSFKAMQNIGRTQKQFIEKMSFRQSDYLQSGKIDFVSNPWSNPEPQLN